MTRRSNGAVLDEPPATDAPAETPAAEPEPETLEDPGEPADDSLDVPASEGEVLDDAEKVGRLSDPRKAVVSIIEKRLERMLQPVDEDEVWHGVQVITRRDLAEALLTPLPPASIFAASVRTPAFIYVDAVCPVCGIAGEISLEVEAKLVATAYGRKLQLAAKAAAMPHQCGQQRLRDVTPTRPVKGQTALDLGDEDAGEEGADILPSESWAPRAGETLPGQDDDEEVDVRPTGDVNPLELQRAAERDAGGRPADPLEWHAPPEQPSDDVDPLPF